MQVYISTKNANLYANNCPQKASICMQVIIFKNAKLSEQKSQNGKFAVEVQKKANLQDDKCQKRKFV